MFELIAFDADDTLWHNESLYLLTQDKFKGLLSRYHSAEWIEQKLYETEVRNLRYFGYGVKGFTLSMIETAIELTEGRIQGNDIQLIINFAKEMQKAEVQLMDRAAETVAALSKSYRLMLLTKGDLFDQETKIARSGLAPYFKHIEIVSEKTPQTYQTLLAKYHLNPRQFLMVGNSLNSDILPVVAIGGQAIYIPHHLTWAHETRADQEAVFKDYFELEHLGLLPALLEQLNEDGITSAA